METTRLAGVGSFVAAVAKRRGVGNPAVAARRVAAVSVAALLATNPLGWSNGISGLTDHPIKGNAIIDWVDFV